MMLDGVAALLINHHIYYTLATLLVYILCTPQKRFLSRGVSGNPSGSGVPGGRFLSEGFLETLRAVEFLVEGCRAKGSWKPFAQARRIILACTRWTDTVSSAIGGQCFVSTEKNEE